MFGIISASHLEKGRKFQVPFHGTDDASQFAPKISSLKEVKDEVPQDWQSMEGTEAAWFQRGHLRNRSSFAAIWPHSKQLCR
ncbi:MAG: hypothetical protein AB1461_13020 [Thermodesulfobacteriota bacterium]